MYDLSDAFPSERLLPETSLDIVKNLRMSRVRLIEDIFEMKVCRPKAVAKVLCKYPATVWNHGQC